jgi:hypothetical protein
VAASTGTRKRKRKINLIIGPGLGNLE